LLHERLAATGYWTRLDLEASATQRYGHAFARRNLATQERLEMLFRPAEEAGAVPLPSKGFGAPQSSARASLANRNEHADTDTARDPTTGRGISSGVREYPGLASSAAWSGRT